jgi:hypothetical protein
MAKKSKVPGGPQIKIPFTKGSQEIPGGGRESKWVDLDERFLGGENRERLLREAEYGIETFGELGEDGEVFSREWNQNEKKLGDFLEKANRIVEFMKIKEVT